MFKLVLGSALLAASIHASAEAAYKPLPLPTSVRVKSSAPRVELWKDLSRREKKLAYRLIQAANAGRYILFQQNHRHGLLIKATLEKALSSAHAAYTKSLLGQDGYNELLIYAAKFEDLAGPYETSNRKYVLSVVTPSQIDKLFEHFAQATKAEVRREVMRLLTDEGYEVIQYPEDAEGTDLENAGGNMYEKGVTGAEVAASLKAGMKSNLNCRIVRANAGSPQHSPLRCEVQALSTKDLDPAVRLALTLVVAELQRASKYALTSHQKAQFGHLIRYFQKGDVEDFRAYNIEWVKDRTSSKVDFMMGYVEVYQDYLNQIGSWESYVQIVDPTTTEQSQALARNAQYFEDQMPYGEFKKHFPADYSPPALMVYYFQEIASMHSGGYNLPNFDDIRRDVGAKNIIRLDLPGEDKDDTSLKVRREALEEFMPRRLVDKTMGYQSQIWRSLVLLHEIIGHGSGTYDTTKYGKTEDPISALGALGSALEEQRADLAALVFVADPKLVAVGLYKDQAEANQVRDTMYDWYMQDFLRRTSKQRTFTESHQRGHWLVAKIMLERGVVGFVNRDGSVEYTPQNAVLEVKDHQKFFEVCRELLGELQRIKAVRDEAALKKLFTEHAPLDGINEPWAQAVIKRGEKLMINAGSVEQPWTLTGLNWAWFTKKLKTQGELSLESASKYWK